MIVQSNSGTFNTQGSIDITLPSTSSGSNIVVMWIMGNTIWTPPGGAVLRDSDVDVLGHYLYEITGGSNSWTFTTGVPGSGCWFAVELANSVHEGTLSDRPNGNPTQLMVPTVGERIIFASLAWSGAADTVTGWSNSFDEQFQYKADDQDRPAGAVALRNVIGDGVTGYDTLASFSGGVTYVSSLISSYTTVTPQRRASAFFEILD